MSGYFSTKYLRYREITGENAPPIDHDVHCPACGYNLRGLRTGGRCPECGLSIDPKAIAPLPLVPDDPAHRTRVAWGLLFIWVSMLATVGLRLVALASAFGPGLRILHYALAMILVASMWCVGVWWSLPERLDTLGRGLARERRAARWGAVLMPIGYALFVLGVLQGLFAVEVFSNILRFTAGVAALLHLHVLSVGAWHSDLSDESDKLYNLTFWTAIGSPLVIFAPLGGAWIYFIWLALAIVLWAIAVVRLALVVRALEQFLRHCSRDLIRAGTRLDRILEKRAEIDREVEATIRPYRS